MDGYEPHTYGDAFADVYDDWYADVSDVDATCVTLLALADGPLLELGVGTGRLAVPLALAGRPSGIEVAGIDTSQPMLDRLAERDSDNLVSVSLGDMVDDLPRGPFSVAFIAYNTLFNLTEADRQRSCFNSVASRLMPNGRFVVEAFVPDSEADRHNDVSVRSIATDRVVLSVSRRQPDEQTAHGQFVEITESGGVRLRPWSIRYTGLDELDEMATAAGFRLEHRWSGFDRSRFDTRSDRHVSVYQLG